MEYNYSQMIIQNQLNATDSIPQQKSVSVLNADLF